MVKYLTTALFVSFLLFNGSSITLKKHDYQHKQEAVATTTAQALAQAQAQEPPVIAGQDPQLQPHINQPIVGGWSYHAADQQSESQKNVQSWIRSQISSLDDGFTVKRIGNQVVAGSNYLFDFQNQAAKQKINVKVYENLNGQREITSARKLKLIERDDGTLQDKRIMASKDLTMDAALNQIF